MERSVRARLVCFALGLGACAAASMKLPSALQQAPEWQLSGYTHEGFRESDIVIEGRVARGLTRIHKPARNAHPTSTPAAPGGFRFQLAASNGSALQVECAEQVDPKKLWVLRFGEGDKHLDCTCREGERARAKLSLVDGKGALQLGEGPRIEVAPVFETADGKKQRTALGYTLSGASGSAALELTGHGRAWPLPGLSTQGADDLSCVYAALLLYRPGS